MDTTGKRTDGQTGKRSEQGERQQSNKSGHGTPFAAIIIEYRPVNNGRD